MVAALLVTPKVQSGVIVAGASLPKGSPYPGPKFQHKLAWFERLIESASGLCKYGHAQALAGDFNFVPSDFAIDKTCSYDDNARRQAELRDAQLHGLPAYRACASEMDAACVQQ